MLNSNINNKKEPLCFSNTDPEHLALKQGIYLQGYVLTHSFVNLTILTPICWKTSFLPFKKYLKYNQNCVQKLVFVPAYLG